MKMETETHEKRDGATIPTFADLISEFHPVTAHFLAGKGIFDLWYPIVSEERDVSEEDREIEEDLLSAGALPERQLKPGETDLVKACKIFKAAVSKLGDPMKLMKLSAPRGTADHPNLGTIGSNLYYGGAERKLDKTTYMDPPIWLGKHVSLRWSAKLQGPALVEDNVFINTSSVVVRSIIGAGTQIDDLALVKESIIGRDVYICSGVKIEHRIGKSGRPVSIVDHRTTNTYGFDKQSYETGRVKFGAIIGDGCHIGSNAVLSPGTILLPGCVVPKLFAVPPGIYDPAYFDTYARGNVSPRFPSCS
jgi:carbonic anhydrase/acetyltransferase-like protein (isoleucine patch superfamily)